LSRSWTTRARRPTEAPDAYTFVDKSTFEAQARTGGFLEWASVLGELYGTPMPDTPSGMDVLLEIDVQGAHQVLTRYGDVVCILLLPPSEDDQYQRLVGRGDSEERARERLELGRHEMDFGREIAGYVVVNEDVDRTVDEFVAIIEKERAARAN
jgi:guanylate kinase